MIYDNEVYNQLVDALNDLASGQYPGVVSGQYLGVAAVDAVADKIRAAGIKGDRASYKSCPVARYLSRQTGRLVYVGGGNARVTAGPGRYPYLAVVPMPWAVQKFVQRFDAEFYEDLEDVR